MNTEREKPLRTNRVEDSAMNGLPVTYKTAVWHIGELEPLLSKRTGLSGSDEGPGISVSECPDDWRQIARLGGSLWQLSRTDGEDGKFIDFHELTPAQRSEYTATALRKRLIKECTRWKVSQGHSEFGEMFEYYDNLKEAERAATSMGKRGRASRAAKRLSGSSPIAGEASLRNTLTTRR